MPKTTLLFILLFYCTTGTLHCMQTRIIMPADNKGETLLHVAAYKGYTLFVQMLLLVQADPNKARTDDGATPLFIATQNNHLPIIQLLLKARADVNKAKTDGTTPLFIAACYDNQSIIQLLLKAEADPNKARTNGATPLFIAALNGHQSIVELLLAHGANPTLKTIERKQPVEYTTNPALIRILLEAEEKHYAGSKIEECSICREKLENETDTHKTACNHAFHISCIKQWKEYHPICPLCRENI